jgi:hypothetical protein
MSTTKPPQPLKPDIYKYKEIDSFKFEFSSFKSSILFLFFGFLATWYLASGQGIENFIHGIVLLVGVGLGVAGIYLFFQSFKFSKKTIRISKTKAEIIEDNKSYEKALATYREELEKYNNDVRQNEEAVKKRISKANTETLIVVYESTDGRGKPTAIVKRSNNTYAWIERSNKKFEISEKLIFPSDKINAWNWFDEAAYLQFIPKKQSNNLGSSPAKQKQPIEKKQQPKNSIKTAEQERQEQVEHSNVLSWQSKVNKLIGNLRSDWKEFIKVIEDNKITKLYHFTDRSNVPSIKANDGLHSWWSAEQKGITISKPGGIGFGRALDVRKGLQNHVRLSFNNRNPMLYVAQNEGRILDPIFLEIDPVVMLLSKTLFTKENATKNGVYPNSTLIFLKEIVEGSETEQSSMIRTLLGSSYLINPKAEILVFEKIPLEFITNINNF